MSWDHSRFRQVLGRFATGVSVVSYLADGEPAGMTANAFMSVSLDPPLVLVSVRNQSRFLKSVAPGDLYAVNVLAEDQVALSDHFGGRALIEPSPAFGSHRQCPVIEGSLALVVARVTQMYPAGDHTLVLGAVEALDEAPASPLVFFAGRYVGVEALGATP